MKRKNHMNRKFFTSSASEAPDMETLDEYLEWT